MSGILIDEARSAIKRENFSLSNKTVLMITNQQHPAVSPLIDKVVSIS
ncbi:hypothetical protein [Leuconostoc falkenbergense]|nr:hypothetical protein [Leuconostoc falkenbergense]MDI6553691.1 hypothetical protein [Leuconostoc falkenbergense]